MAYTYDPYKESEAVKQAQAALQQQLQQKPGAYQSQWQQQLQTAMDKILNREKFSYDLNGDALYQQYKDQYTTQGKLAMMDTMGQAAANTGGYSNSYAQNAGQQAYQGYLQQLNAAVPELYQLALGQYQMEGDAMKDRLALLQQQEATDYGRYQDQLSAWLADRDYLSGRYDSERNYDYGKYTDDRNFGFNQYTSERDFAFQQEQAQREQERWQKEFDEAKRQFEEQMAAAQAKSSGGGGGGSYSGNGGVDASLVRQAQSYVGATPDGMWGPRSQAEAAKKGFGSLAEVLAALGLGSGDTQPNSDLSSYLNREISAGASKSEISATIRAAQANGYITAAQAAELRKQFASRGYTY